MHRTIKNSAKNDPKTAICPTATPFTPFLPKKLGLKFASNPLNYLHAFFAPKSPIFTPKHPQKFFDAQSLGISRVYAEKWLSSFEHVRPFLKWNHRFSLRPSVITVPLDAGMNVRRSAEVLVGPSAGSKDRTGNNDGLCYYPLSIVFAGHSSHSAIFNPNILAFNVTARLIWSEAPLG